MELAGIAEDLMAHVPLPPGAQRQWLHDACLSFQPGSYSLFANVSAVRTCVDVLDELVHEARSWFAALGRTDFTWFLGPSSTPTDVTDQLARRGASFKENATAMTIGTAPPPAEGVHVAPVESAADFLTYRRLIMADNDTGELTPALEAELASTNDTVWAGTQAMGGRRLMFLAFVEGQPLAAAGMQLTDMGFAALTGGATHPVARGQGCYRALVHRRWLVAQSAGIGHLVIQASADSAPILASVGFTATAALTIMSQSCS